MNQEDILQAAAEEAARQMNGNSGGAVQNVSPQPVPLSVQVTTAQQGASKFVILVVNSPAGQGVYFFDPDGAEKVANAILDAARLSRTGLEIPRVN